MNFHRTCIFIAALLVPLHCLAEHSIAPLGIGELRKHHFATKLVYEREIEGGESFDAYLVSYNSFNLKVYAMVAVPKSIKQTEKLPAILANHGDHPNPPEYGISADGRDFRPGDYYREIPELYCREGFIVVIPDYRGHNNSEGIEFAHGTLKSSYFAQDVLALLADIHSIGSLDPDNVFMWGHSLGGDVTLKALLASNAIKGASLWSTVGGNIWERGYYYSRFQSLLESPDGTDIAKEKLDALHLTIASFDKAYDWKSGDPISHLDYLQTPLIIHHAVSDKSTLHAWSMNLAKELYLRGKSYKFYSYEGSDHLFRNNDLSLAVARDVAFFRSLMQK